MGQRLSLRGGGNWDTDLGYYHKTMQGNVSCKGVSTNSFILAVGDGGEREQIISMDTANSRSFLFANDISG